ncbi:MAG: hypothetical protein HY683_02530 [Chloroflexi bacterium]|nr:hypothetical protein [Chloroflexota bacterium]
MQALVVAALALVALLVGCSKGTPTPFPTPTATPSPTPTATFEQRRDEVVRYFREFNQIDNSLADTLSQIQFPSSATTAKDVLDFNAAISQAMTSLEGAVGRLAELQPSPLEPETAVHLQKAKAVLIGFQELFAELKDTLAAGDSARLGLETSKLGAANAEASAVNRATEQLLLKYSIPDAEVNYRFRGT